MTAPLISRYTVQLDNYEPPRAFAFGEMREIFDAYGTVVLPDPWAVGLHNPQSALYLIHKGDATFVYYVAGWSTGDGITPRQIILMPMNAAAASGPTRAYHLIAQDD